MKKRGFWIVLALLFILLDKDVFAQTWQIQTVDSAGDAGWDNSIALDSTGKPHITYVEGVGNTLKYAKWTGSAWQIQTVTSPGASASIALDSSNNPHISYYEQANDDLKYAKWTGSVWQIQTVFATGDMGIFNDLDLDASNNAHISFYDMTQYDLQYAKWTGSTWQFQDVDTGGAGDAGWYNSIALDSTGKPHISYYAISGGSPPTAAYDLKYAKWTGSAWQIQTIDSAGDTGRYTSIALDSSNNPHISYIGWTNRDLKYAKWTGSVWQTQIVDSGNIDSFNSIAVDSTGKPHISYHDSTTGYLKYAKWTGSAWQIQTVDSTGNVGLISSIALDSSNNPHISYYDITNGNLKYASLCPCSGTACNPLNNNQKCDGCNYVAAPPEVCDGVDNDCDGIIDEGCDDDNDDYCDSSITRESPYSCDISGSWCCSLGVDCNDASLTINPGATEVCDGLDNNCTGQIDEGFDLDADSYNSCGSWNGMSFVTPNSAYVDCNDTNLNIHPGATEYCGNGIDENCNGQIDETGCTTLTCNSCLDCGVGWWNLCDEVECTTECSISSLCYFVPSGISGDCYDCAPPSLCSTYTAQSNCQNNPCNANIGSGGCMWDSISLNCVDAFEICNNGADDDGDTFVDCTDDDCCSNSFCTFDSNCCSCDMFNSDGNSCNSCGANCYYDITPFPDECKDCAGASCGDAAELCVGDPCSMGCILDANDNCVGGGDVQPQPSCNLTAEWQDASGQKVEVVGAGTDVKLVLTATGDCISLNGHSITFNLCSSSGCIYIGAASFDNGALTDWQTTYNLVCSGPSYNCNPQTYHFKAFGASVIQSPNLYVVACDQAVDSDCDGVCNPACTADGDYCKCVEWDDGSGGDPCAGTPAGADTDETGCTKDQAACVAKWDCSNAKWSDCDESTNTRTRDTALCSCTPSGDTCCQIGLSLIPKTSSCLPEKPFPVFSWFNFALVISLLIIYYSHKQK